MQVVQFGLGVMGLPMARTLHGAKSIELLATDTVETAREAFAMAGGSVTTPDAVDVGSADVVLTMLPQGDHVGAVHDAIRGGLGEGAVLLDCSTIDVETTRQLAARARAGGVEMVDAPVSGGPEGAAAGTLSFMVGGSDPAIEQVRPLFDILGARVTVFGNTAMGQAAKACHNMIVGITGLAVFEGFALADALGLDAEAFHRLCSGAAAACWTLDNRCPVPGVVDAAPSSNDYEPGFAARLMAKDLGLAQAAAESVHLDTPLGREAAARFAEFVADGNGHLDYSAVYRTLRSGDSHE